MYNCLRDTDYFHMSMTSGTSLMAKALVVFCINIGCVVLCHVLFINRNINFQHRDPVKRNQNMPFHFVSVPNNTLEELH